MSTVTRAECVAFKSCADCSDGILLRDSLYYDLDREDEEQLCPAFVHRLARAHLALLDCRDELAKALERIKDVDEGYDSYDAAWKIADDALKGMPVESELAKAAEALAEALEATPICTCETCVPIQQRRDAALAQWNKLKGEG